MENIIIDTSIFIDYDRTGKGPYLSLINLAREQKVKLYVPSIVIMEFWVGSSMKDKNKEKVAEKLFNGMERIPLNEEIAKLGAKLIRNKEIETGFDAIVAASTIYLSASLVTKNTKHFKKIKNLKLHPNL